jgi:CO/xanthine dehydrogenase FAD-binding subunit
MKPQAGPEYALPTSLAEAVGLLGRWAGAARIVAGGTDVLPDLRRNKLQPRCLIDITRIAELGEIEVTEGYVQVGAAVTFAAIKEHPLLPARVPALVEAAGAVGALAIQNAATWAGNLVQAMPAADGAIVALALEAEAHIVDAAGAAWQPVESLFLGPGLSAVDPTRQIVTHIRFALPDGRWGSAWGRLGRRPSLVLPVLNCAVSLGLDAGGQRVEWARIALGPVAPCPYRARAAEALLIGQAAAPETWAEAARAAQAEANPRDSLTRASRVYRLAVIPALLQDALTLAAARTAARPAR